MPLYLNSPFSTLGDETLRALSAGTGWAIDRERTRIALECAVVVDSPLAIELHNFQCDIECELQHRAPAVDNSDLLG